MFHFMFASYIIYLRCLHYISIFYYNLVFIYHNLNIKRIHPEPQFPEMSFCMVCNSKHCEKMTGTRWCFKFRFFVCFFLFKGVFFNHEQSEQNFCAVINHERSEQNFGASINHEQSEQTFNAVFKHEELEQNFGAVINCL